MFLLKNYYSEPGVLLVLRYKIALVLFRNKLYSEPIQSIRPAVLPIVNEPQEYWSCKVFGLNLQCSFRN